jgi:hypothetical protein
MYLAPLNYDRFFKKVFSDLRIAQKFLEDFLGVTIEEISLLETKHKVTDDAAAVEFDFRCKINGQYVIIDMQQWYKSDIVKRFYLYHSLSSVLQLEKIPIKSITINKTKKYDTKNYDALEPVITLIWMADDTLNFTEDYIAYSLYPEQVAAFLKNDTMWNTPDLENIKKNRENVVSLLNNDDKNLDFLPQNRLIYIFQKNICKNKKYSTYFDWFELAEKTRNKNNKKEDFVQYEKNEIFMALMERIRKDALEPTEFQEIDDYEKFLKQSKIHEDIIRRDAVKEGIKEGFERSKEEVVILSFQQNIPLELIATITNLTIEKVKKIIEKHKKQSKKD